MTQPPDIQFGTDGWRAVIADGFTFENVRIVSRAIAAAGRTLAPPDAVDRNTLVVGYDRRFLSLEFAREVATSLERAGYHVLLSREPAPSQTVSHAVRHRNVLGGVIVTASHNPANYNGLKFKAWYGGSALAPMYDVIAQNLGTDDRREGGSIEEVDIVSDYLEALRTLVDLDLLRESQLKILHDPIHGASLGFPDRLIDGERRIETREGEKSGSSRSWPHIDTVRGEVNPSFGGVNPEPIPENLELTRETIRRGDYHLAICNDGDADRLGILDERGEFVSPQKTIALLALYLIRSREEKGELVKTFSTSRLIEKVAHTLGVPLHETPIGFKYVADLMLSRRIVIGGEESGGIGFGFFLPERDGILSGLLVAECIARSGKALSTLVAEMEEEFGTLHYDRRDEKRPQEVCARLVERARSGDLDEVFPGKVVKREEVDGVKLNFADGSWILFRKSGTEPMIRIYCESPSKDLMGSLLDGAVAQLDRA